MILKSRFHDWGKVSCFLLYSIISAIYCHKLIGLNSEIKAKSYFFIVAESPAIVYFFWAVGLVTVGLAFLAYLYAQRWQLSLRGSSVLVAIIIYLGTVVWIVRIIFLIQNPILRAILAVYIIGTVITASNN